ncbi:MAG: hypothetical protein JWQ35_2133 [Bacteriovoracaceae bacterium]|nr:hypothetical protein [Bacteriovoracaceae bacterium]
MNRLLSDWTSNIVQQAVSDSAKEYIRMGRVVQRLSSAIIIFQIFLIGIQFGLIIAVLPWLAVATTPRMLWIFSILGIGITFLSLSLLITFNSERYWIKRLRIDKLVNTLNHS